MAPDVMIILAFVIFLALLGAGMSIPFAITIPGIVYLLMQGGLPAMKGLGLVSWGSLDSFTLTAIPLFIFMAEIMQSGGLTLRIYRGLAKLVAPIPGGLLQTNIAGCALFASISGSSVATAASIGSVALPQLLKRNYHRPMAAGSLAAGGTLGILFPPSLAMIVYSSFTEVSVAKLFMAGVFPGLILTGMFMAYIAIRCMISPGLAPKEAGAGSFGEMALAALDVVPFMLLIGGILGSIYAGWMTPGEAAARGRLVVLLLCAVFGELRLSLLNQALQRAVKTVGNILFIVYAAYVFSYAISLSGVGESVTAFLVGLHLSRTGFFVALFLLYTLLGCLVESLGMIVITVPLLFPVLLQYGFDPGLFGVILVMFIELGQISPPIGINLFVIQSIWDGELGQVVMGTIPFHIIMFVLLTMLVIWPDIALWLPEHMPK